jgi:hypothetical protein
MTTPWDLPAFDPDPDPDDGVRVEAWGTTAEEHVLTAYAVCSNGPDAAQQTYTTKVWDIGFAVGAGMAVECPNADAGDRFIGGGGGVDQANEFDWLTAVGPREQAIWVGLEGANDDARSLVGTAICLPDGTRNVKLVERRARVAKDGVKTVRVYCPPGKHVTGGGAEGSGHEQVLASRPIDGPDGDRTPDDGWAVKVGNAGGFSKFKFFARAVCVGPVLS